MNMNKTEETMITIIIIISIITNIMNLQNETEEVDATSGVAVQAFAYLELLFENITTIVTI